MFLLLRLLLTRVLLLRPLIIICIRLPRMLRLPLLPIFRRRLLIIIIMLLLLLRRRQGRILLYAVRTSY